MVQDAAQYEAEDKGRAELIEIRNKADNLVYHTEVFLRENAKAITPPIASSVQQSVDAAKTALSANAPKDQLLTAIKAMETANSKMHDACFSEDAKRGQAAPASAPGKTSNVGIPTGDVVDVQFEIKE